MPYVSPAANARADKRHADLIAHLHRRDRAQYDMPGSIHACACVDCNRVRESCGTREKTWREMMTR